MEVSDPFMKQPCFKPENHWFQVLGTSHRFSPHPCNHPSKLCQSSGMTWGFFPCLLSCCAISSFLTRRRLPTQCPISVHTKVGAFGHDRFQPFQQVQQNMFIFFIFWVTMFSFHKCWSVIAIKHRYLIYHQLLDPLWNRLKYHVLPNFSTDISSNICHIRSSRLGKIQATIIDFPKPPATPLYQ